MFGMVSFSLLTKARAKQLQGGICFKNLLQGREPLSGLRSLKFKTHTAPIQVLCTFASPVIMAIKNE